MKYGHSSTNPSLEEKINLIKEKEQGVAHRELCDKFHISIGAVSALSGCLELVRRRRFSITQQPELQSFIIELESKLTDALFDSNLSQQRSILDYFRSSTVEAPTYVIK